MSMSHEERRESARNLLLSMTDDFEVLSIAEGISEADEDDVDAIADLMMTAVVTVTWSDEEKK